MSSEDTKKALDKRMSLKEAVSRFVFDGCSIAFSGMGGQQVVAPAYEIVRQGQKDMTLMGDSPCRAQEYLEGPGQLKRVEVAWLAFAVAGISTSYRRAVEEGIPPQNQSARIFQLHDGTSIPGGCHGPSLHDYKIAHRLIDRKIQRHDQGNR